MVAGKVCRVCSVWKELDGFHKHVSCTVDGHKRTCITCEKKKKKEYTLKNKEKLAIKQKEIYEKKKNTPEYKAKVKAYQQGNKEKLNEQAKERRKNNSERFKEREAKYRNENREKLLEYSRRWKSENKERLENYRNENREAMTEYNKRYWAENKEKQKEALSLWRKENAQRIREYRVANRDRDRRKAQEWHASERGNKLRVIMTNKYRAKKRKLERNFTPADWDFCLEHFDNRCAYCGADGNLEQEHFIPVTKDGPFTRDNIVPACRSCNANKTNRDFHEWYKGWEHYSVEREKRILQFLGKEVPNDPLQVHGLRNK